MGRPAKGVVTDWIDFFDAVDETRRSRNFSALKRLYSKSRRTREKALINATARFLADEQKVDYTWWSRKPIFLNEPYFVSGFDNLKASALLESNVEFRKNNIFVLANFLERV